jgi:hypothetical protein
MNNTIRKSEPCPYCLGNGKKAREHFFPKWTIKVYPVHFEGHQFNRFTRKYIKRPASTETVKSICATCNSTWMSEIQNDAKPIIEPFLFGKGDARLTKNESRLLSYWMMMTSMSFDLDKNSRRFFSHEQRSLFRRERIIPEGTSVFVGFSGLHPNKGIGHRRIMSYDATSKKLVCSGIISYILLGRYFSLLCCNINKGDHVEYPHISSKLLRIYPHDNTHENVNIFGEIGRDGRSIADQFVHSWTAQLQHHLSPT